MRLIGARRCDPWALGGAAFLLRYHLGKASHVLAGLDRSSYGLCIMVKSMRGWDPNEQCWRRPAVFGGSLSTDWSCAQQRDSDTTVMLSEDLVPITVAA